MMEIAIIDYGAGNIRSLQFALQRLGFRSTVTNRPEILKSADKVIFPGVGEASSAMAKLESTGLDKLIPQLTQPVLGICLGMQLLCNTSEEGNTTGLGIFDVSVKRFTGNIKVPQMGWNTIGNLKSELFEGIPENAYMYLVHSYYAPLCDATVATTHYGGPYTTALKAANFYGVQFHPEKSSKEGQKVLQNFIEL